MSETAPRQDTLPLPEELGDPAAEAANQNLDPALHGQPGVPAPVEGTPGGAAPEANAEAPAAEQRDGYVKQSREAYDQAKENGKQFMRNVGRAAVSKFVRFRRKGSKEATEGGESTPGSAEATRTTWKDRATAAKGRATKRVEQYRENRREARINAHYARKGKRIMRQNERADQKRREDVERRADRLDDQAHKATMSRKEYNAWKYKKQARKDYERDQKMWADWRAQKEAKELAKRVKKAVHNSEARAKVAAKAEKAGRKAAAKAEGKAYKMNEKYDERHARAAVLRAERARVERLREDPAEYAKYLKAEADRKRERRQARVQRVQRMGGKVLHGANVATKVAVGAAVNGGELAASHSVNAAEALKQDERVQYVKLRAELGMVAVRKSLSEVLAKASERLLPTTQEVETMAQTGELPLTEHGEVEVSIDHAEQHEDEEPKVPAGV